MTKINSDYIKANIKCVNSNLEILVTNLLIKQQT